MHYLIELVGGEHPRVAHCQPVEKSARRLEKGYQRFSESRLENLYSEWLIVESGEDWSKNEMLRTYELARATMIDFSSPGARDFFESCDKLGV